MGTCLCCGRWGNEAVCGSCRSTFHPAPDRRLDSGVIVRSLLVHEAAAAVLVRRLKYQGIRSVARVVAAPLLRLLPADATALVPVPRIVWRRIRYGIDPASELARALGDVSGLPVVRGLVAPLVAARHAGRDRRHREEVAFRSNVPPPEGAVLVDDVVTTGATLASAHRVIRSTAGVALTVTAAPQVTSLPERERDMPVHR